MDAAKLATEVTTDPTNVGYALMSDRAVADALNAPGANGAPSRAAALAITSGTEAVDAPDVNAARTVPSTAQDLARSDYNNKVAAGIINPAAYPTIAAAVAAGLVRGAA